MKRHCLPPSETHPKEQQVRRLKDMSRASVQALLLLDAAGHALDALYAHLPLDEVGGLIVVLGALIAVLDVSFEVSFEPSDPGALLPCSQETGDRKHPNLGCCGQY